MAILGTRYGDTLSGTAADDEIFSGAGPDTLFGRVGHDLLDGGNDGDSLSGGSGDDTLLGNTGNDSLYGGIGEDLILGGGGRDILEGNSGDDTLRGHEGRDNLSGGAGNDILIVGSDSNFDYADGNSGDDILVSGAGRDWLRGGPGNDLVFGGSGDDMLIGHSGDDTLLGHAGQDELSGGEGLNHLSGGSGDDYYVLYRPDERIVEAADGGTDTFYIQFSRYHLPDAIENMVLSIGAQVGVGNAQDNLIRVVDNVVSLRSTSFTLKGQGGNDTLKSLSAGDRLFGGSGDDELDGGAGNDTLFGGAGDDSYMVESEGDKVIEGAGAGQDSVISTINYALVAHVEELYLTGTRNPNGHGNKLDNVLVGNSGGNTLNGREGSDTLTGGAGEDTFLFTRPLGPDNVDTITDFSRNADVIQLHSNVFTALAGMAGGTLDAAALRGGTAAMDADDRIIYDRNTGQLFYDEDGTGAADQILFAVLSNTTLVNETVFEIL